MAHKDELSEYRKNMVINTTSKYQEVDCNIIVNEVINELIEEFDLTLVKEKSVKLKHVVEKLKEIYPEQDIFYYFDTSNMKPDGRIGIFS